MLKSRRIRDPRKVASDYLNLDIWGLHDRFYQVMENEDYKRIVVLAPRGHGKSQVWTHVFPVWSYLKNRNSRTLIAAKAKEQSVKLLSLIKQDFERNPRLWADFGDCTSKPWQDDKIYLQRDTAIPLKDPTFEAVGVLGAITGSHFDNIVLDDIIDDENVRTEKRRQSVLTWLKKTVEPLLEPGGRICAVGTRKHYRDVYQHLLDNPSWYHVACQERIYGDHRRCGYKAILQEPVYEPIFDSAGILVNIEVKGDYSILLPERWTIQKLLMNKISMGTPIFESEYQNNPTALEGLLFDEDWIQYYKTPSEVEAMNMKFKVMAFDLAVSEKQIEGGDFFAGVVIGLTDQNKFYVIDIIHEHLDFPSQVRKILLWYDLHRPDVVVIETNAYQKALAQHLQSISTLPIVQKKTVTDKYTRLLEISPYFESKRVYIREDMEELVQEYKEFPRGEHEDILDALQMAISDIISRSSNYEFFGWRPGWARKRHENEWIASQIKPKQV